MAEDTGESTNHYAKIAGMDSRAETLLSPNQIEGERDQEDDPLFPFTYGILSDGAGMLFDTDPVITDDMDANDFGNPRLVIPEYYKSGDRRKQGDYVVAFANTSFFYALAEQQKKRVPILRDSVKSITLSLPLRPYMMSEGKLTDPPLPAETLPDNTVVVGIIDDGIAFAHERFRTADGNTRVQFFWRQDGASQANPTVSFGSEYCKADGVRKGVDSLLASHTEGGIVDEDEVYREAGFMDFREQDHNAASWRRAHGTHVLDVAAGYKPSEAPPNIVIIAVQLPTLVTEEFSAAGLESFGKFAVDYIVDRADRLAGSGRNFPVVINFSYGLFNGPHNGTSSHEKAMDVAIANRKAPLSIVLPSGNGRLSRCHAEFTLCEKQLKKELTWRIQPDDRTVTMMEIWLPYDARFRSTQSRVKIWLETPSGTASATLDESTLPTNTIELRDAGLVFASVRYEFKGDPIWRGVFFIDVQPTARLLPIWSGNNPMPSNRTTAPAGAWKVHVEAQNPAKDTLVQAWIYRDDVIYGYRRRGRQSYFEDPADWRFDPANGREVEFDYEEDRTVPESIIKRRGMISGIATGCKTVVIGGICGKELEVEEHSDGGPVAFKPGAASAHRTGPDVVAISDDSRIHDGVLAAGSRSGSAVVMNGTSVAAPQITRIISQRMPAGFKGTPSEVQQLAEDEERRANPPRPTLGPPNYYGKGRITARDVSRPRRIDPDI